MITRNRGGRQGNDDTTTLCNLILHLMHQQAFQNDNGIHLNMDEIFIINGIRIKIILFNHLEPTTIQYLKTIFHIIIIYIAYADDLSKYNDSINNAQQQINQLQHENIQFKMSINKTKFIIFNKQKLHGKIKPLHIHGHNIQPSKVITYLGTKIDENNTYQENVEYLIDKMNTKTNNIWYQKQQTIVIVPILAIMIIVTYIRTICETNMAVIPYTPTQLTQFNNCIIHGIRNILQYPPTTSNWIIAISCGFEHQNMRADKLQLTNFYKMLQKPNNTLSKQILLFDMILTYNFRNNEYS